MRSPTSRDSVHGLVCPPRARWWCLRYLARPLPTLLLMALLSPGLAGACPSCPLGRQARAEVWSQSFGLYLLIALLPFLIIGAACWCLESPRSPGARLKGQGPHASAATRSEE